MAEAFAKHLPIVINAIKPFFSSEIEKGVPWAETILKELKDSSHGLIFLTKESLASTWVHFETGAIAKQVDKARVYTILIGLQPTDVPPPLALFQHTRLEDIDDIKKLVRALYSAASQANETTVTIEQLDTAFALTWPALSAAVATVLSGPSTAPSKKTRPERELLEELLELSRHHSKRIALLTQRIADVESNVSVALQVTSLELRSALASSRQVGGARKAGARRPGDLLPSNEPSNTQQPDGELDFPPPANELPF